MLKQEGEFGSAGPSSGLHPKIHQRMLKLILLFAKVAKEKKVSTPRFIREC